MRLALLLLALACGSASTLVSAQDAQVTATILQSERTGVDEGVGDAFDRTLRARLDALGVVGSAGAVALDLEQIQLALGCMGETVECLTGVTAETGSTIVLVPSLAQVGATTQATVLVFDSRDQSMRRATREAAGENAGAELLGATEGMLRELFGLPAQPAGTGHDEVTPPGTTPAGLSPAPFVLMGVGALAVIGGVVAGVLSSNDADAYARAPTSTEAEVDAALSIYSRADTEALAANILYIGGAVLIAAGVTWELAAGREDGSSPLALTPSVGPGAVGLALSGSFGGDL